MGISHAALGASTQPGKDGEHKGHVAHGVGARKGSQALIRAKSGASGDRQAGQCGLLNQAGWSVLRLGRSPSVARPRDGDPTPPCPAMGVEQPPERPVNSRRRGPVAQPGQDGDHAPQRAPRRSPPRPARSWHSDDHTLVSKQRKDGPCQAAKSTPAAPMMSAPVVKASSLSRRVDAHACAASSSSRIARQARPMRERSRIDGQEDQGHREQDQLIVGGGGRW